MNAYGNTPLHTAVRAGQVDIVCLLLEKGYDMHTKNHLGSTALHLCAFLATAEDNDSNSKQEVSSKLAEKRLTTNPAKSSLIVQPHLQIAAIFLSNDDFIMINEKDNNGYTPLHIAAQRGCDEMIKLLIDSGADLSITTDVDAKGRGGRTAKETAKFSGQMHAFAILEEFENNLKSGIALDSRTLTSDIQSCYSVSNPIVGAGGVGVRRNSAA